ncbi:hypothetical protein FIBSPDRAFT_113490 [Athelia psychrophila]|uniref:Uncharacterized protein n=1 Tax=Athelia psychrophila TaxID=1759441 RepID=A0A166D407_9AGAM|nr:hypothetical protein FIBSPDRAFT_113490 [Fibularhizoctonia sp. CBS 109695]
MFGDIGLPGAGTRTVAVGYTAGSGARPGAGMVVANQKMQVAPVKKPESRRWGQLLGKLLCVSYLCTVAAKNNGGLPFWAVAQTYLVVNSL